MPIIFIFICLAVVILIKFMQDTTIPNQDSIDNLFDNHDEFKENIPTDPDPFSRGKVDSFADYSDLITNDIWESDSFTHSDS